MAALMISFNGIYYDDYPMSILDYVDTSNKKDN